jgi:leader peptidase (prepilin peptidase)/N-methyltransferase
MLVLLFKAISSMHLLPAWIWIVWFFLLGTVIGSFLNVLIYRLPRRMNIAWPPSHCPACRHRIRWYDNIPILSWLLLRGRCRDCKNPISWRYPLVESLTGIFFALAAAGVMWLF